MEEKSESQPSNWNQKRRPSQPWYSQSWFVWTVLLLLVVLVAGGIYIARQNSQKSSATTKTGRGAGRGGTVTLTVATATKGSIGIYLDGLGIVTPVYTSTITAQASGVLTEVHYREGQPVKKGDDLIDIDPRPYEAQLKQAEGTLDRDTNLLAQAQMDVERYRAAWAKNSINKQLLDDQEKVVLQDQGTVKNDQGTVDYDQVQLTYCHITAPISGRVGLRLVDPGNVVQANSTTPLVVIAQIQPITVIFTLAEDSLGEVQARLRKVRTLPVDALDRAQATKLASGTLLTVDNQIDTTTGTVKLRAQFDNRDGALFPNQFVNARLLVNTQDGVTLIPANAIQHNGDTAFVYVIANSTATMRTVKTGASDSGQTAVTGINPGDVVATSSFDKLQNGIKVQVAKPAAPRSNAAEGSAP
jgi:multidrug efflux system membrane fusion protein